MYEYTANPGGGAVTTRFLYDGAALVAEFNTSNTLLRRYVHGPGLDEPIVWYERNGGGTYDRKWLVADERGSVTAIANDSGAVTDVYTYDEYGNPNAWSGARFRYTGQVMLAEAQLYHYKARVYDPRLGRFLQTDPIGFGGGMNIYGYASNNPVNFTDPLGLQEGPRLPDAPPTSGSWFPDPWATEYGARSIASHEKVECSLRREEAELRKPCARCVSPSIPMALNAAFKAHRSEAYRAIGLRGRRAVRLRWRKRRAAAVIFCTFGQVPR